MNTPREITLRIVHYTINAMMIIQFDGVEVATAPVHYERELSSVVNVITKVLSSLGYARNEKKTYADMSLTVYHFELQDSISL